MEAWSHKTLLQVSEPLVITLILVREQMWPPDPALRDTKTDDHWQALSGTLILPINFATEQLKLIKKSCLSVIRQIWGWNVSLTVSHAPVFYLCCFRVFATVHMSTLYKTYGQDILLPLLAWGSNPGSNLMLFKLCLIRTNLMLLPAMCTLQQRVWSLYHSFWTDRYFHTEPTGHNNLFYRSEVWTLLVSDIWVKIIHFHFHGSAKVCFDGFVFFCTWFHTPLH